MSLLLFESVYARKSQSLLSLARRLAPARYEDAVAEAQKIEKRTGVRMTVEALKPVHFGFSDYTLPVGDTVISLKNNVVFYPVGLFSTDLDFSDLVWYSGAKIQYIGTWPAYLVPLTKERSMDMRPQPIFRTTFTFRVNSKVVKSRVDAWIIGYVVLPRTLIESKIAE